MRWTRALALPVAGLAALAVRDLTQKTHAIRHNFPVVGHARYLLEEVGPELRQYIVTDNNSERPFSRDQRRWTTPRRSARTPTSASAPTTTWSGTRGMPSSGTAPSRRCSQPCTRTPGRRRRCPAPRCSVRPVVVPARSVRGLSSTSRR